MQVTLAQAGIVAGILTLSWVVGRPKEILSAPPTGNHPHQVFNSTSKAHAEKVASLVPDSIVKGDSGHPLNWFVMSKTPYAEARSYYAPWLRENDYFRSNQFLSEVKYEAEYSRQYQHELWREGDMRIVADYDEDFWSHNVEGWFDDDKEYEAFRKRVSEHGVYVLTLEKQVQGEWERLDSVRGTVPNENLTLMDIAKEQFDFKEVESFEAPYTGAGALMGISGDSDLSSFTSKELTESSAIHGDFDQASLNYSGHQNLEVRAEAVWDDEDYYDHEAAWERIFEVWMEEWVTGGATSRDILKIYAAKNGFWDYEEVDVTTATAWYDGLTIADREDEIIGADPFNLVGLSSADPAELKKKVALFEALKEIIEDQMDSWDDQFQ